MSKSVILLSMSYKKGRIGSVLALLIYLFASLTPSVAAASSVSQSNTGDNPSGAFNVVVSPTSKSLVVRPGGSVSETIQFKNQGLSTENIKLSVMKFSSDNKTGLPVLSTPTAADTYVNWAKFSQTNFSAPPNVWESIKMTISPPSSAAFGYYYAVIFSRNQVNTKSNVANLLGSVASLVLLDVQAPGEVRHTNIAQFSTDHNIYEFLPATFNVKMQNTGNVHVAPRGNIIISKGGKQIATLEVNLAEGNVLPHSSRIFTSQWSDGSPVYQMKKTSNGYAVNSKGKPVTDLSWNNFSFGKLRFGKYNAQLIMVYNDGEGDVSTQAHLSFWVIPWRIIAAIVIVVILLAGGLWTLLIKPLRRKLRTGQGGQTRHN